MFKGMKMCEKRVKTNLFMVKERSVKTMFPKPSCSKMMSYFATEKKTCRLPTRFKLMNGYIIGKGNCNILRTALYFKMKLFAYAFGVVGEQGQMPFKY